MHSRHLHTLVGQDNGEQHPDMLRYGLAQVVAAVIGAPVIDLAPDGNHQELPKPESRFLCPEYAQLQSHFQDGGEERVHAGIRAAVKAFVG